MEAVLNHINMNIYLYLLILAVLVAIIILLLTKPKRVKPIEVTIDDVENEKTDIEKVLESLEENKNSRPMTTFEEEQEANAIISYQELVEAVKAKKEMMGSTVSSTSVPSNAVVEAIEAVEEVEPAKEETKKFKNSEFISPIFGKDSNKTNDEFLKELKNFRSNL